MKAVLNDIGYCTGLLIFGLVFFPVYYEVNHQLSAVLYEGWIGAWGVWGLSGL